MAILLDLVQPAAAIEATRTTKRRRDECDSVGPDCMAGWEAKVLH
jgi:hypothetical protein